MRAIGWGVLCVSSVAAAQDVSPPGMSPISSASTSSPTSTPGFLLADRQDGESRAGVEAEYFLLANSGGSGSLFRVEAHGQWISAPSQFGGYVNVPLVAVLGSSNDDTAVLGNLEAGGIYLADLHNPNLGLVVHAGITLPTGPSADSDKALLSVITGYMHPASIYQSLPRSSTARLGVSPIIRSGQFFARFDLGLELNLYIDSGDTVDPGVHFNAGFGLDLGTLNASLLAEVSTLHVFSNASDNNLSAAAISVRGHSGVLQPYFGFELPIDKEARRDFDGGFVLGLDGRM